MTYAYLHHHDHHHVTVTVVGDIIITNGTVVVVIAVVVVITTCSKHVSTTDRLPIFSTLDGGINSNTLPYVARHVLRLQSHTDSQWASKHKA